MGGAPFSLEKRMDLSNLMVTDEAKAVDLVHPVTFRPLGTPEKPVRVMIVPPSHPRMRAVERRIADQRVQNAMVARGRMKLSADEIEAEAVDRLVACIESWEGIDMDGKPLKVSAENARMLMTNPALRWLRDQVDQALGDHGTFLAKPELTTSNPSAGSTSA